MTEENVMSDNAYYLYEVEPVHIGVSLAYFLDVAQLSEGEQRAIHNVMLALPV
jgi:hypothetical protein